MANGGRVWTEDFNRAKVPCVGRGETVNPANLIPFFSRKTRLFIIYKDALLYM